MKSILTFLTLLVLSSQLFSQWENVNPGHQNNFRSVFFQSSTTGYGLSVDSTFKTTNGGANWFKITQPAANATDIFFSGNTGYACRQNLIYKTTDGGLNWVTYNTGLANNITNSIYFNSATTGWVAGRFGTLAKTTNGGVNWTKIYGFLADINSIYFANSSLGWLTVEVDNQSIYKTTNGGVNWVSETTPGSNGIKSVNMDIDGLTGLACGNGGKIYYTTNGGANWSLRQTSTVNALYDICIRGGKAFCVGTGGVIFRSDDNGDTWNQLNSGVNTNLVSIDYVNTGGIWVSVGINGVIIRTTNYGGDPLGIEPVSNTIPEKFELSQNYPNPFNPATNIRINMPKEGYTKLTVFDVTGKEAAVLVDENLKSGEYNINFNASNLTSGVYFYRLTTDEFTNVKKMILVK